MTPEAEAAQRSTDTALGLWRRSQPILGTLAERYLRDVRRIEGALPPTLRFLPANGRHPPAMVAAFGLADETDPDAMTIEASALRGVHLTKLCLDGRGKADMEPNKIMLGRGHTLPIVLAPMNDMGGLAITEGIEDALSIHMATGLGVWAAGSAPRLPGLAKHVPANIMCVTVFIDADPAGERFGSVLAERLEARGFEVIAKHWAEAGHGS
jgi:Toprim domain